MELSIVTTLYRSQDCVAEFVERITACARSLTQSFEIVLVNDGCPETSLEVALNLYSENPHVKIVDLSRNFGHHPAIMAGLEYASGEYVYLTNVDLEERPEYLKLIWNAYFSAENENADVVYGFEGDRKGHAVKRTLGGWFYYVFNFLSDVKLPKGQIVSRLMSRRYVDALLSYKEHEVFMPGLWELAGFEQVPVSVDRETPRSKTTYSMGKRVALAVRAITSFSGKPLVYIFYLGTLISALSALVVIYVAARKIFLGVSVSGWTSLIVSLYLLGGLIIFSIGVLGVYLSRIFVEMKRRPNRVVRKFYANDEVVELKAPKKRKWN